MYTIDESTYAAFRVPVTTGSKWYEVMSGDPPLDLEKKIESKEWAGTLPAARDEWGSLSTGNPLSDKWYIVVLLDSRAL